MSSRTARLPAIFIALALLLAACGFRPLYAERGGVATSEELSAVRIALIPDRTGQLLRNELLDRMNPRGGSAQPRFDLTVQLTEQLQNLAVRRDDTATRANLILTAAYDLVNAANGTSLLSGTVRSVNSYNISSEDFATVSAETDARERGARDLADEITVRVAVFLTDRPSEQ